MKIKLIWYGQEALDRVQTGGTNGVRNCAQMLLDESKKQVPLDTGALQRSGAVDSDYLSATVSYDTPYAAHWHEHNANFQRGRKSKYLEDPLNDPVLRKRMLQNLTRHIDL